MGEEFIPTGYIRDDGMVFWHYGKGYKNGQYWVTPERFQILKHKHSIKAKERQKIDPSKRKAISARFYAKNSHKIRELSRAYYSKNRSAILSNKKEQRALKDASRPPKPKSNYGTSEYYRNRYKKERDARIQRAMQYEAKKMQSDGLFRLKKNVRRLVLKTFEDSGFSKNSKTAEILGCSFEFFKAYIEQRFLPGMGWHNRSEWHLDHIIPAASAKTEKQLLKLNHYTNFRPLWAIDNLSKGAKTPKQLTLLAA